MAIRSLLHRFKAESLLALSLLLQIPCEFLVLYGLGFRGSAGAAWVSVATINLTLATHVYVSMLVDIRQVERGFVRFPGWGERLRFRTFVVIGVLVVAVTFTHLRITGEAIVASIPELDIQAILRSRDIIPLATGRALAISMVGWGISLLWICMNMAAYRSARTASSRTAANPDSKNSGTYEDKEGDGDRQNSSLRGHSPDHGE